MLMIVSSGSLSVAALCPAQTSAFKLTAFNVAPPDALEMTLDDRRHIVDAHQNCSLCNTWN